MVLRDDILLCKYKTFLQELGAKYGCYRFTIVDCHHIKHPEMASENTFQARHGGTCL